MNGCTHKDCVNRNLRCHICVPIGRLYKTKKRKPPKKAKKKNALGKTDKYQKEGMEFQDRVAKRYNELMGRGARQQPNSGAFWGMPGDVITEELLQECKERGTVSSRGEKQITIKKEMLEKIKKEANFRRIPVLPFGFKNDDNIYVALEYDLLLEVVQKNKILEAKIKELEEEKNG